MNAQPPASPLVRQLRDRRRLLRGAFSGKALNLAGLDEEIAAAEEVDRERTALLAFFDNAPSRKEETR